MSQPLKILAIVIGGLFALGVVAALVVSMVFDPNDYKDEITSQVKTRTGRTLTLEGDLDLSFFPWLGVETGKATLGNAPGFGDEPFASIERANVTVRLMPLLQKRIEAGTIAVDGARINLVRNREGHGNWEDLLTQTEPAAPAPAGSPVGEIAIAGLELRDASLSFRDEQAQSHYVIDKISLETGVLKPGEPVSAEVALTVNNAPPGYTSALELKGDLQADTETSRYDVDDLELNYLVHDAEQKQLASGTLTGKLSADLAKSVYVFDGVQLKSQVLAGTEPLDVDAGWATARVDQAAQRLEVTDVRLKALDLEASIPKIEGTNLADSPQLNGVIDVPQASIPKLLHALAISLPAGIDPNALGTVSLHGPITAQPSAGIVQVSGLKADVLGMHVQGDLRTEGGKLKGNVQVPQFATAQLFQALGSALPADINFKAVDKLAVTTGFEMDTAKQTFSLQGLKADLLGTTLLADLQAPGGTRYTGKVRVDKVAPEPFMAVFGKLVPEGLDANELGELALSTRFDMKPAQHLLQLDELAMTLVGLQFSGNLTLSNFPESTAYNGDLSVARFSPRALLKRFGAQEPQTADANVLRAAEGKAHVTATPTLGRFENVALTLDDSRITGSFAVNNFDDPAYDFALLIDKVDVDRYLPPPAPEEQTQKKARTGDVKIPVETLKTLKIGGKVRAGAMKLGGIDLQQLDATLSAKDNVARLEPVSATLYEGKFTGGFTADTRAAVPTMTIQGQATDIRIGQFLQDLSDDEPALTGKGSFNLQLTGQGNTYKKNLRSSDGSVDFSLRDGALKGFDLGYSLCSAYNTLARLPKPQAKDTKKTPFQSITGTAIVKDGLAATNDLTGTTTFMKVTGQGTLNLPKQELDYDMNAGMSASTKLRGCSEMDKLIGQSFPLDISGTVLEPKIRPDFGDLARSVLQKKVEEELKDKLLEKLGGKKKPEPKKPN